MNVYYTAKDIEEMAAKGTSELTLGPGVFLTDYARETARQLNIALIKDGKRQGQPGEPAPAVSRKPVVDDRYNKPLGCQHGPTGYTAAPARTTPASQPRQAGSEAASSTVDRLVNLMGKAIKRGG